MNREKQRNPPQPRPLSGAEVLVLFALDAEGPEVDDEWLDDAFQDLAFEWATKGVWFGSWKVLRVLGMRIETPEQAGSLGLPGVVLDELQAWDGKQGKADSIRVVAVREYPEVMGCALVIHVPDG